MRSTNSRRMRQSGSVLVMFTLMLPFLLVPMVGLAIDATMIFSVRAKLQTAVDGAAIAAAQSLNSGVNFTAQKATAEKTADQFIRANFPVTGAFAGWTGYWAAHDLNDSKCDANGQPTPSGASPCVIAAQDDQNKRRTVTVSASVQVPLLFMRMLGFTSGQVAATGMAARRDVVLVLVIDRSSSMDHVINGTNVIDATKDSAAYFVNQFSSGRDRLGLVVFGGSAMVAYPPGDWGKAWNSGTFTGPDTSFKDTPDSAAVPNILTSISNIEIGSNTGTAEALMLAYKELQAANKPGALNAIVLFTDGLPNGITATFNTTGASFVRSASTCSYKDNTSPHLTMTGWMAQWGGFVAGGTVNGHGIFGLSQTDTTTYTSVTDWLQNGQELILAPGTPGGQNGTGPGKGCAYEAPDTTSGYANGHYNLTLSKNVYSDVTIPSADLYGNSTLGSGSSPYTLLDYRQSEIWGNECNNGSRPTSVDLTKSGDACVIGLASWNATDMAAKTIRSDTNLLPVIYAMGFEGNGGDDPVLMRRLANVSTGNTVYDSTKPKGMYLQIATPNDIAPAFQYVLAEILRLAM